MTNPVEEHRADLAAFEIMRYFGYSFMIRSMEVNLGGTAGRSEVDLIGVRMDAGYVDAFEFKVGTKGEAGRDKRKVLRRQLENRRDSGLFRHVWAAWDHPNTAATPKKKGFGSFWVDGVPVTNAIAIKQVELAPELPVRQGSRRFSAMRSMVRQFAECWHVNGRPQGVHLRCVECLGNYGYWYLADFDMVNEHEVAKSGEHSSFCPKHPRQVKAYASIQTSLEVYQNGELEGVVTRRNLNVKFR